MARDKLKKFRISTGKTQQQMAETLDITLSFYTQIECGAKNPSMNTLKKFKKEFPTASVDDIFLV